MNKVFLFIILLNTTQVIFAVSDTTPPSEKIAIKYEKADSLLLNSVSRKEKDKNGYECNIANLDKVIPIATQLLEDSDTKWGFHYWVYESQQAGWYIVIYPTDEIECDSIGARTIYVYIDKDDKKIPLAGFPLRL